MLTTPNYTYQEEETLRNSLTASPTNRIEFHFIPADVREAVSFSCFKSPYVKWFLNKQYLYHRFYDFKKLILT